MLSTVDWEEEMTTKSRTVNYSSVEDMTMSTAASGSRVFRTSTSYTDAITDTVIGVLGTVTNGLVLGGFGYAGRAKMNVSGAHIANHTTLELSTASSVLSSSASSYRPKVQCKMQEDTGWG